MSTVAPAGCPLRCHLRGLACPAPAGFAPQLARRLPSHNGYRTLGGADSALAQVHPSCGALPPDDDGLLPEWVVYHELMATGGRAFLSKVRWGLRGEGSEALLALRKCFFLSGREAAPDIPQGWDPVCRPAAASMDAAGAGTGANPRRQPARTRRCVQWRASGWRHCCPSSQASTSTG